MYIFKIKNIRTRKNLMKLTVLLNILSIGIVVCFDDIFDDCFDLVCLQENQNKPYNSRVVPVLDESKNLTNQNTLENETNDSFVNSLFEFDHEKSISKNNSEEPVFKKQKTNMSKVGSVCEKISFKDLCTLRRSFNHFQKNYQTPLHYQIEQYLKGYKSIFLGFDKIQRRNLVSFLHESLYISDPWFVSLTIFDWFKQHLYLCDYEIEIMDFKTSILNDHLLRF